MVVEPFTAVLFLKMLTLHLAPSGTGWTFTETIIVGWAPGAGSNHVDSSYNNHIWAGPPLNLDTTVCAQNGPH